VICVEEIPLPDNLCYTRGMKLALKITPQRSTQYAKMTEMLATPELLASPLALGIQHLERSTLAGQAYLLASTDASLLPLAQVQALVARLGAISEAHEYFEQLGEVVGPLLRPLEPSFVPFVPLEMAEARRYKGKTNEIFTRVLLNVALFSGAYANQFSERLRILDPLAGGGTTLFLALASGYDAFGIEQERQDVETTAVFIRQFLDGERIRYKEIDEHGRRAGRRHQFEIGPKGQSRALVISQGDTRDALVHMREVVGGPKMHAIVADLPYGIQHFGEISKLLSEALPVWESMLLPGGSIALAWNATRIERIELLGLFLAHTTLQVCNDPPYTQFSHPVDRVIKKRDIIVAVKP
jgi:hypothetical protein